MNFKHVEEQIVRARELDCMLASHAKSKRAYDKMQAIAEHLPDTMQALLDVAKAAESVIECHASTGIPQKNQSMATVQAERHSRLMQLHLALAKLQEQNDEL